LSYQKYTSPYQKNPDNKCKILHECIAFNMILEKVAVTAENYFLKWMLRKIIDSWRDQGWA